VNIEDTQSMLVLGDVSGRTLTIVHLSADLCWQKSESVDIILV
jgi:hypothetical protein